MSKACGMIEHRVSLTYPLWRTRTTIHTHIRTHIRTRTATGKKIEIELHADKTSQL